MNPGDRAHRRWPVPEEVKLALAPHYRMSEYERARVYDYFAVLYSVIDAQKELLEEPVSPSKTVETRLAALEAFIAPLRAGRG
jgi:hypothetical protein